ncbi:CD63 antigen-like protein [Leptotrombidium deliense]|uniref:Tetraspanin n=1 Tax=Leptotrombidium deliense TaxID=299467 RepID=A0A443SR99_9ACAR|nr:CD63 antigen-like protein [Leptotrombidium deliense]
MQPSSHLAVSIIFLGLVVFLISFFGCCGAWKESYCLLYTYGTIVFIILVLELVAAGFTYKYRHQIHDSVDDVLKTWIEEYKHLNDSKIHEDMDNTQWDLKCCGANSPNDWLDGNSTAKYYPLSCCPKEAKITTCDKPFEIGCTDALFKGLQKSSAVVIGVAITVAIIELLAVIMSCSLASSFKKQYEFV